MKIQIEPTWKEVLESEFDQDYFKNIAQSLREKIREGRIIYPPGKQIFTAFNLCPFDRLKVVILGQDPYHGPGEAMGLCFSVPQGIRIPPSLRNIYKELKYDLNIDPAPHGDLSAWASQGVFLLNTILTVEHKSPGSHRKIGWEKFTDRVISSISEKKENIVFLLWGNYAQSKKPLIDAERHLILESVHPSPFTGNRFFHQNHFSKTNAYLLKHNKDQIEWNLNA